MTLIEGIKYFTAFMIVACFIGLLIRSIQEKLHPALWYFVILGFWINVLFDLIAPIILFIQYLFGLNSKSKNLPLRRRIRLSILSILIGYYFLFIESDTYSDEKFWQPFRDINKKMNIKSKKYKTKYKHSAQKQVVINTKDVFTGLQNKINELYTY